MDQVSLTRAQLRKLAEKDQDVTILDCNTDARMILIVPTKHIGDADKRQWMRADGRRRRDDA